MSTVNQEQGFKNRSMAIGIIAVMYIYLGFYHLTAPFAPTYVAEVLPYSLRAKGTMLYHLCASVSLVFNNYVNPTAMDAIEWKYYIVFCVWIGVEALAVYFTFPETGGELRRYLMALEQMSVFMPLRWRRMMILKRSPRWSILIRLPVGRRKAFNKAQLMFGMNSLF